MSYFEDLLKDGYYISIKNCIWNNLEYKDYRVQKDVSSGCIYIACHLNLKAFKEVTEKFNFKTVHEKSVVIECNKYFKPYALRFETQTKEPLKITFN